MPENESQEELFSAPIPPKSDDASGGFRSPLAARMRPRDLSEIFGNEKILGENCLLPKLLKTDNFGSLIFYGPPGCGKTTLAEVIAKITNCYCVRINAVLSNSAEVRDILRFARHNREQRTLLLIDEIHRFNKAQQDLLLPDVEAGNVRIIGCTTHNPGFYIIPPLLSRSHLFKIEPAEETAVLKCLENALQDKERGLGILELKVEKKALVSLAKMSEGDMRRALNALETIALAEIPGATISIETIKNFAKERQIRYDNGEDDHYDTISAFIKSVRGSDPDAALYWLAVMLEGGEDPRFIARRLVILASEDIGLADSRGISVAIAAFQACEFVGMPECQLSLAHATIFLATCPKSNSATEAIFAARKYVKETDRQAVPIWLRDSHTKLNRSLGQGDDYLYSHQYPEGISGQKYMLEPKQFYIPKINGAEKNILDRISHWNELRKKINSE